MRRVTIYRTAGVDDRTPTRWWVETGEDFEPVEGFDTWQQARDYADRIANSVPLYIPPEVVSKNKVSCGSSWVPGVGETGNQGTVCTWHHRELLTGVVELMVCCTESHTAIRLAPEAARELAAALVVSAANVEKARTNLAGNQDEPIMSP